MALNHIRYEVVLALAQTKDLIRETGVVLERGEDAEKVDAAGELDFLLRQKAMLERRLEDVDQRLGEPETALRWFRQEWFNLMLHFESWIAHG
jgi:hypothetical protein